MAKDAKEAKVEAKKKDDKKGKVDLKKDKNSFGLGLVGGSDTPLVRTSFTLIYHLHIDRGFDSTVFPLHYL